jgi:molybdopterin converting factor small subunit
MRKYSINLIELILSELKNGATVSELSKKYSIDRRRISEWKNNKPELKTIEVFNKIENKTEIEKTITSSSSKDENTLEDILNKNGISPDEWEVSNASINQWTDSKGVLHNQSKVNVLRKRFH